MGIDDVEKREGNRIPRLRYGKSNKQNRYPRFVDLDVLTDKIISYIDTKLENLAPKKVSSEDPSESGDIIDTSTRP